MNERMKMKRDPGQVCRRATWSAVGAIVCASRISPAIAVSISAAELRSWVSDSLLSGWLRSRAYPVVDQTSVIRFNEVSQAHQDLQQIVEDVSLWGEGRLCRNGCGEMTGGAVPRVRPQESGSARSAALATGPSAYNRQIRRWQPGGDAPRFRPARYGRR